MVDVFISYPRNARARVEPIKARLEALGLDCFFDLENIDGGPNFPDIIDRALRASKTVLCCWSPQYFERPWCMIECRDGLAREIMVPVALERFERFAPPADMRHLNYFDLTAWNGADVHEGWNRTLYAIGKLVGRQLETSLKKPSPESNSGFAKLFEELFGAKRSAPGAAFNSAESSSLGTEIISDLRETWRSFPERESRDTVLRFLERVRISAPGSGLEFEVEHHFQQLNGHAQRRELDLALLGLPLGSSANEIRTAYRKLMMDLHPDVDRNWEKPEIAARIKAITGAFDRLTA
jgi:hypothetical protein